MASETPAFFQASTVHHSPVRYASQFLSKGARIYRRGSPLLLSSESSIRLLTFGYGSWILVAAPGSVLCVR